MFEIHITTNKLNDTEVNQFKEFCASIEAKPILIELAEGITTQQPMISKVFSNVKEGQLTSEIELLETNFLENSYDVVRTKVEVPLDFINRGRKEFPNYKGQYYEWHGKVEFDDIEKLKLALRLIQNTHLSKNALKDQPNRRFVTVRSYSNKRFFLSNVESVKKALVHNKFKLIKDEYEYCVYDSNKTTDSGWMDIPEITDQNYLNLLAFEGYLRRATESKERFLLKGSLLTRQYLNDINVRDALDLDFIYGEFIDNDVDARSIFTNWVTQVTEAYSNDNIEYNSFKENEFWRRIDYAMNDDFPTTNTDLSCKIDDVEIPVIGLDISWNLPLEQTPVPLDYKPQVGENFTIPFTVPLPTQIAWKLHQSIVRPRAKDLIDIILLFQANQLGENQLQIISEVYINECVKDKINPLRLIHYSNGEVFEFLSKNKSKLDEAYNKYWSLETPFGFEINTAMKLPYLDDMFKIDFAFNDVQGLVKAFEKSIIDSGITNMIETNYKPKSQERKIKAQVSGLESNDNEEIDIVDRDEKKQSNGDKIKQSIVQKLFKIFNNKWNS